MHGPVDPHLLDRNVSRLEVTKGPPHAENQCKVQIMKRNYKRYVLQNMMISGHKT